MLKEISHTMKHFGRVVKENTLWPLPGFYVPLEDIESIITIKSPQESTLLDVIKMLKTMMKLLKKVDKKVDDLDERLISVEEFVKDIEKEKDVEKHKQRKK
ncbi:uncharacterized protein LOC130510975 [Raphanus sativus]|uniref:Uncharacterized protein LOC130510975 n=1 Tax=Raphanus sativus TaxID=3726 RepID=A0A9W3DII5_RAPSA|nr:uncharacterized protein LOC130510975 [Raphanus sativus]